MKRSEVRPAKAGIWEGKEQQTFIGGGPRLGKDFLNRNLMKTSGQPRLEAS